MFLYNLLIDVPCGPCPSLHRFVDEVNNTEGIRVLLFECIKLFVEQDIRGAGICVNESELCVVGRIGEGV